LTVATKNSVDLLLAEETLEEFGYDPRNLSHGSKKRVLHKCAICGKVKESMYREFLLGIATSHRGKCAQQKQKQTCLEKYGVDSSNKSEKIKEKKRQRCLEKYGVDNPRKSKIIKKKIRKTWLDKYGIDSPNKVAEVKKKKQQTWLNNHGVDNPSKSEKIKRRKRQTCFNNYGVDYPMKSREVRQKAKESSLSKYGTDHPRKSPAVKEKAKKTWLNNYGVDNPRKSQVVKKKIKRLLIEKNLIWTQQTAKEYVASQVNIDNQSFNLLSWGGNIHQYSAFKCPKGHTWKAKFNSFQQGSRCPICRESKGERQIAEGLKKYGLFFERQHFLKDTCLRLDFYIPSLSVGIEYDGEQHFKNVMGAFGNKTLEQAQEMLRQVQERDKRKNQLCQSLGITLYRVRYDQDIQQSLKTILSEVGVHI
jgi:very-short-patch-repair endonuclease/predicted XRE-type DNA-binding protein